MARLKGPDFCSNSAQLEALLRKCDPGWTPPPPPPCPAGQRCPLTVFPGGHIPSLVLVPPAGAAENGTLIGFSEWVGTCGAAKCSLGARRSTDRGASWGAAAFPADEATQLPSPGTHSHWCY
jgi:hypothetical protein